MLRDAQKEFREGLRIVTEQFVEQLRDAGIAITVEGVTYAPRWQEGEPIPATVTCKIAPIGRQPFQVVFSNEEIEDCWEGLDRAEVRRKLRETVDKFAIVDRKTPGQSEEQRFQEADAILKMAFPRIHERIVSLWGTGEGESFLDKLILDDRGNRQGFPSNVMSALLVLQRVHFQRFGTFKKFDLWDNVTFGKLRG